MAARRTRAKVTTGAGIPDIRTAGTPESAKDNHGLAAFRKKLARGGKVIEGKEARPRLDRRAAGGKVKGKGKMTVNVIVAGGPGAAGGGAMPPMPAPAMGALAMPPPRPPMAAPPPPGAMPLPGAAPTPMMPRAKGGRVAYPIKDGAGGGEGRLEKIRAYGRKALEGAKVS